MESKGLITNSQIALEFFSDVLMLKGIITPEQESRILDAVTISELDDLLEEIASEVKNGE